MQTVMVISCRVKEPFADEYIVGKREYWGIFAFLVLESACNFFNHNDNQSCAVKGIYRLG